MSDVRVRIDNTSRRVDEMLTRIALRDAERQAQEDAARARADSERCRQAQVKYDEAYRDFGVQTPAPVDGERPGRYRQRLYEGLRRKLPSNHELFGVRAD